VRRGFGVLGSLVGASDEAIGVVDFLIDVRKHRLFGFTVLGKLGNESVLVLLAVELGDEVEAGFEVVVVAVECAGVLCGFDVHEVADHAHVLVVYPAVLLLAHNQIQTLRPRCSLHTPRRGDDAEDLLQQDVVFVLDVLVALLPYLLGLARVFVAVCGRFVVVD